MDLKDWTGRPFFIGSRVVHVSDTNRIIGRVADIRLRDYFGTTTIKVRILVEMERYTFRKGHLSNWIYAENVTVIQ